MKTLAFFSVFVIFLAFACETEESERFKLITGTYWQSDSLLANGADASGPGGMLEKFKGNARFNKDGTGVFGVYTGTWKFAYNDTEIIIDSDSLDFPLTTHIEELTASSFKITTAFPNMANPSQPTRIRLTFIPD
jgi:hypothetical protein